jgi:AcrR family transcriptional regulator
MARKPAPRPRDSDGTKAAILAAARERFASGGYERATIRAIASDAAIDPALVMRYFGNKEKLFAAAADFDLRLPDLTALPRGQVGAAFVAHFIDRWEDDDTFMALIRVAVTNEAAATRVREVLAGQVAPVIAALSGEPARAGLRAGLVASQILGMALCRYVLRLPPVVAMTRADVVGWLGPTVQRYVTGSLASQSQRDDK